MFINRNCSLLGIRVDADPIVLVCTALLVAGSSGLDVGLHGRYENRLEFVRTKVV
jgi:hypothetical protein